MNPKFIGMTSARYFSVVSFRTRSYSSRFPSPSSAETRGMATFMSASGTADTMPTMFVGIKYSVTAISLTNGESIILSSWK